MMLTAHRLPGRSASCWAGYSPRVPEERKRLRELGLRVGRFPAGSANALVDVPGVRVGHRTLMEGDSVRTGVTAVLPHGGNAYAEKVLGACHVVNGYGKAAGLSQ